MTSVFDPVSDPLAAPDLDQPETRFRVREPADLVVLAPYLLHFHPSESLVAMFFRSGRLVVTVRLDLGTSDAAAPGLLAELDRISCHAGSSQLVLLAYSEQPQLRSTLERVAQQCRLDLLDALWVSEGRWWSVLCRQGCCPPEGRPYDPLSHPMAAEAVLAGMGVGADRDAVTALASGPAEQDRSRLLTRAAAVQQNLTGSRRTRQRRMKRLVDNALRRADPPDEQEALTLAVLATDISVRDVAFASMSRACAENHVRVWVGVVRRTPDELAAAPLCLLAVAGWLSGGGALLNACVERLQSIAPGYPMGQICGEIADGAVSPDIWDEMLPGFRLAAGCR